MMYCKKQRKIQRIYATLGITIETSHDTAGFACDCIRHYWKNHGKLLYPHAPAMLLLCDYGGSNNARHYLFKEQIQLPANDLNVEIRIAHYPPYTSKYNPVEHRLFPHVTKACKGPVFKNADIVRTAMGNAKTKTGLKTVSTVLEKIYDTGKKVSAGFKQIGLTQLKYNLLFLLTVNF